MREHLVFADACWATVVAIGLARVSSSVEGWPQTFPSSWPSRQRLARRLAPRVGRLVRAAGWVTVGLVGLLAPVMLPLRYPLVGALAVVGWGLLGASSVSRGDFASTNKLMRAARFARWTTASVGAASLLITLVSSQAPRLLAVGVLSMVSALLHGLAEQAAMEVSELESSSPPLR